MNARRIIAAAVLMGTTASAQGIITPSVAKCDTSATSTSFLTPQSPGSSWQQIHQLGSAPTRLESIAWRLRRPGANTLNVTLSVDVSNTPTTYLGMGTDPDANHGPDRTRVVTSRKLSIVSPATIRPGAMAFDFVVPFDRPFDYDGSGSLCWEVFLEATDWAGSPGFDYAKSGAGINRREWDIGTPCPSSGWPKLDTTWAALQLGYTAQLDLRVSGVSGTLAAVGFDMRYSVSGLPPALGLPLTSCGLYVQPQVFAPTLIGPRGFGQFTVFAFPFGWEGTTLYTQAFALVPAANPLGVLSSNGRAMRINICGNRDSSVLFFPNQRTGLGIRYIREGLATRFN